MCVPMIRHYTATYCITFQTSGSNTAISRISVSQGAQKSSETKLPVAHNRHNITALLHQLYNLQISRSDKGILSVSLFAWASRRTILCNDGAKKSFHGDTEFKQYSRLIVTFLLPRAQISITVRNGHRVTASVDMIPDDELPDGCLGRFWWPEIF